MCFITTVFYHFLFILFSPLSLEYWQKVIPTTPSGLNWGEAARQQQQQYPLWLFFYLPIFILLFFFFFVVCSDLFGAVSNPLKFSRTVVTGLSGSQVSQLLYLLTYFIRCPEVEPGFTPVSGTWKIMWHDKVKYSSWIPQGIVHQLL